MDILEELKAVQAEVLDGSTAHTALDALMGKVEDAARLETVKMYGVKGGEQTYLGEVAMPWGMKAKEIIANYIGSDFENEFSDSATALHICTDLVGWMGKQENAQLAQQHAAAMALFESELKLNLRALDVALNGIDGAAPAPLLIDILAQVRAEGIRLQAPLLEVTKRITLEPDFPPLGQMG